MKTLPDHGYYVKVDKPEQKLLPENNMTYIKFLLLIRKKFS